MFLVLLTCYTVLLILVLLYVGRNYLEYTLWLRRILFIRPRPATKEGDAGSKMEASKLLHISRNMIRCGKRLIIFYSFSILFVIGSYFTLAAVCLGSN